MSGSWDCAWGRDPLAEDDHHGLGCEAGCGEDAAANWDNRGLLSRGGLPYCSMACLLFVFGCEMLDSLPLEVRAPRWRHTERCTHAYRHPCSCRYCGCCSELWASPANAPEYQDEEGTPRKDCPDCVAWKAAGCPKDEPAISKMETADGTGRAKAVA